MSATAEVVAVEQQLTVANRTHPELSDVWISLEWTERTAAWIDAFNAVALDSPAGLPAPASLQLVSAGARFGWIVARAADLRVVDILDLERSVRALVQAVNEAGSHHAEGPVRKEAGPVQRSLGAAVAEVTSAVTGFVLGRGIDSPSRA